MSNGIVLAATTPGAPHVTPPSKDRLNAIVFAAVSFQAAYTSPFGPTKGTAAITRPGPEGSSMRVNRKCSAMVGGPGEAQPAARRAAARGVPRYIHGSFERRL